MNAAEQLAPPITDGLTWAQICEQYPDQWVCVVEIEWDEPKKFYLRNARVVGHGVTRSESLAYAKVRIERLGEIGHYYTGKVRAPFPRFFA